MTHKCAAIAGLVLLAAALSVPACRNADFPAQPTPLASSPVAVQQGNTYHGTVMQGDDATSFDMTIIARGLAAHASTPEPAAGAFAGAPSITAASAGAVEIAGNFQTGRGLRGSVQGTLQGSLADGQFSGRLITDTGACEEERRYAGPVTAAGVAWVPGERLRTCATNELAFAIQIGNPRASACSYTVTVEDLSFSGTGGKGTANVNAPPGCPWLAETPAPWVTFGEPSTGVGQGTIEFNVQPNPRADDRQASVRIAGQTVTLDQGPICAYSISTNVASFGGTGGRADVGVTAPARCAWDAAALVDWIAVSPSKGSANGTVTLTIPPNPGPARQGSVRIAEITFTVLQGAAPPQCSYAIAPPTVTVGSTGGSGTIAVTAPPGCAWNAQTSVAWLTILGTSSGIGPGSVSYAVQPNAGTARTGTAQIAGQVFTVTQTSLDCTYTITPAAVTLGSNGDTGTIAVSAPAGCAWSAETSVDWLTILGSPAGSGPGAVSYAVQPNTGALRTGTARIAGQTFTVTQSALACTFAIAPSSASLPQGGGSGVVAIATQNGCVWTAQPRVNWIVITNVSAGAGKDSVSYAVAANVGPARAGTLLVAGQIFTVTQPHGCTYVVAPAAVSFFRGGGTATISVTSPAGCAWKVGTSENWVTIRNIVGSGGGSGSFTLDVSAQPADAKTSRTTTIRVDGEVSTTVMVTQSLSNPGDPR